MGRFFVDAGNVRGNEIIITDANDVDHLTKALRASEGDCVEVSDSSDWEYTAQITRAGPGSICLRITDKRRFAREPRLMVTLYQGLPKAQKMDAVIQKSVELGVGRIVPVFCSRTIISGGAGLGHRPARWKRISGEAAKQCGRGRIPEISGAIGLEAASAEMKAADLALFPYENEAGVTIKDCLRGARAANPSTVSLIIGPEGGFSDEEAQILKDAGAAAVSLGRTVLRTETAGPAAIAMIMYELEL